MHAVMFAMYICSVRVVPCKQHLCSLITHYNSILYIPTHAPNLSRLWTTFAFTLALHYEHQWLNLRSIRASKMQRISNVSLNPEYNLLASSTEHFRRGDGGRRQMPLALLNTRFGRTQEVRPQPSKQRLRDTSFVRQIASLPPAPISAGQDPSNITNPAHTSIAQGFPAQLTQPPNKQSNDESDEEFDLIYEWYTNPALTTTHFSKYVKPRKTPCLSNEPQTYFMKATRALTHYRRSEYQIATCFQANNQVFQKERAKPEGVQGII